MIALVQEVDAKEDNNEPRYQRDRVDSAGSVEAAEENEGGKYCRRREADIVNRVDDICRE